jgi:Ca2+-binding EF-hand superfamily protein
MSAGLDLKVLRFLARLNAGKGPYVERRFIISCFLSDNTIVVYEPPVRNSGMIGGKFLERSKLLKPGQVVVPGGKPPKYYTARDMFVGVGLELNKHQFILIDADEYAYNYMEQHAGQYPQSDISLVMSKLVELTRDVRMETLVASLQGLTHLPTLDFSDLVKEMSAGGLIDQEIITLARYYQDREEESVSVEALLSMLQEQMKRAGFEDFRSIEERCLHFDGARTGTLDAGRVRTVFRSVNVPVQDDMLRAFIAGLADHHGGRVDYAEMVRLLNWRFTPTEPLRLESSAGDDAWFGNKPASLVQQVNMQALLQDLMGVKRT